MLEQGVANTTESINGELRKKKIVRHNEDYVDEKRWCSDLQEMLPGVTWCLDKLFNRTEKWKSMDCSLYEVLSFGVFRFSFNLVL